MTINLTSLLQQPDEGTSYWFDHDLYTSKAVGKDTGEAYALCECIIAPKGGGTPPHRHSQEDESFYIQEGELEVQLDDQILIATSGTFIHFPKGQLHRITNASENSVKMLV